MKYLLSCVVCCVLLGGTVLAQNRPMQVSMVELLATPERLDGKLIMVRGLLRFQRERRTIIAALLNLNDEDARNLLGNEVSIAPSEQMRRDWEKFENMYVSVTGVFRAAKIAGDDSLRTGSIVDVRSCTVWSDPKHPVGRKGDVSSPR
jgi:hypothetical protein